MEYIKLQEGLDVCQSYVNDVNDLLKLRDIVAVHGYTESLDIFCNSNNDITSLLDIQDKITTENFAKSVVFFIRDIIKTIIKLFWELVLRFIDYVKNIIFKVTLTEKKLANLKRKAFASSRDMNSVIDDIKRSDETMPLPLFTDMLNQFIEINQLSNIVREIEYVKRSESLFKFIAGTSISTLDGAIISKMDIKRFNETPFKFLKVVALENNGACDISVTNKIPILPSTNLVDSGYVYDDVERSIEKLRNFISDIEKSLKNERELEKSLVNVKSKLEALKNKVTAEDDSDKSRVEELNLWLHDISTLLRVSTTICKFHMDNVVYINRFADIIDNSL